MKKRKSPKADLERKRLRFLQIGLVVSLGIAVTAFEWTTYSLEKDYTALDDLENLDPVPEIPEFTEIKKEEPKPKPKEFKMGGEIVEVNDKKEVREHDVTKKDDDSKEDLDIDLTGLDEIGDSAGEGTVVKVPIYGIGEVGVMPEFNGNMYQWIAGEINYPPMAKQEGVQGKVYVEFVIDQRGVVKDAKVVRGIGYGCDKEAIRVISKMPAWSPARQMGIRVPVRLTLPIKFVLR